MSLALGANPEGKERARVKLMEYKVVEQGLRLYGYAGKLNILSQDFLNPIGCPVSPPSLSSQNVQSHEKSYTNYSARGETPTVSLRSRKPVTTLRGITWET